MRRGNLAGLFALTALVGGYAIALYSQIHHGGCNYKVYCSSSHQARIPSFVTLTATPRCCAPLTSRSTIQSRPMRLRKL